MVMAIDLTVAGLSGAWATAPWLTAYRQFMTLACQAGAVVGLEGWRRARLQVLSRSLNLSQSLSHSLFLSESLYLCFVGTGKILRVLKISSKFDCSSRMFSIRKDTQSSMGLWIQAVEPELF